MLVDIGTPFRGVKLERVKAFLERGGLAYDQDVTFTVNLMDEGSGLIATGSLQENIIKCVQVDEGHQGEGLTGTLLTHLTKQAMQDGYRHLFLFTKPENGMQFGGCGFYEVARTRDVLMMENIRGGVANFVEAIKAPDREGITGAVVMNCNPFTLGHRYLIERAAADCGLLYVLVLSEDRSEFPANDRLELVRQGVADLKNVVVCQTGPYLVSSATFPTYFLKDKADADRINCGLDLTVFRDRFAGPLGIRRRYVGTEPASAVTAAYNRQMKEFFSGTGLEVVELERKTAGEDAISASKVRGLLAVGDEVGAFALVPPTTKAYLQSEKGRQVIQKLRK